MGELRKRGWAPKRTIIYAAWDGEEPALLGSTEWVETHLDELRQHAVAYLNTDGNARGFLSMGGSHTLERFINDVARDIKDPETSLSVWARRQAQVIAGGSAAERTEARGREDLRIDALGSGSDFSPFLQHAGIAALDLGFGGEDSSGIYHSVYDDFYFYAKFLDKDFLYGRALAQTVGTAVIRLADADLLPFEFTNLADTVETYVKDLKDLVKRRQDEIAERNRQIESGVFAAMNDPRQPTVAPKPQIVPPAINFAPLENASTALVASARHYQKAAAAARPRLAGNTTALASLNAKLRQAEQQLLDPSGLPNRSWYQHLLYAPGLYTGYGVKTVPGVREGVEQAHYREAEGEVVRAANALSRLVSLVDAAAADLDRVGGARH
jgi:N-acetylated-alpha-linked acidic dipeptidase